MHALTIADLEGTSMVSTPSELADAIKRRFDGANHYMIASVDAAFPMLDIMLRDEYAVIHYFESEGVAGDQSVSNAADPPDDVAFPENLTGASLSMPGSVVIEASAAIGCVEQFAQDLARPTVIHWREL